MVRLSARHVRPLGRLIDERIHCVESEVHSRVNNDWLYPGECCAHGCPVQADSATGVSIIRSMPNCLSRSVMELPTYQGLHKPRPMTNASGVGLQDVLKACLMAVP